MTFREWIQSYNNNDESKKYAELAEKIFEDGNFPIDAEHEEIIDYVEKVYKHDGIVKMIKGALEDYRNRKK